MGQIHKYKNNNNNKKKNLGFEPTSFHVVGEPSPDWPIRAVSVMAENKLYIAKQLNNVRMEGQRVQYRSKRIIRICFCFVFIFSIFLFRFVLTSQFYRDLENTFQSIMYND